MADESANGTQTPPASPPASSGNGSGDGASAGTIKPETKPFHETLKELMANPDFQDYFNRQIDNRVQAKLDGTKPKDVDEDTKSLMGRFAITEDQAKGLVQWRDSGVEKKLKPLQDKIESNFSQQTLTSRIASLRMQHDDLDACGDTMLKLMSQMDETQRGFILNSPDGIEYLYEKARKTLGLATTSDKLKGGGGGGRGQNFDSKTGGLNTNIQTASKVLNDPTKSDRQRRMEYEQAMQSAMKE